MKTCNRTGFSSWFLVYYGGQYWRPTSKRLQCARPRNFIPWQFGFRDTSGIGRCLTSKRQTCARSSVWIERGSPKAGVVGSNPTGRIKISFMAYVYILQSQKTGKYYIGSTKDLQERLKRHFSGDVSYTRLHLPLSFVFCKQYSNLGFAKKGATLRSSPFRRPSPAFIPSPNWSQKKNRKNLDSPYTLCENNSTLEPRDDFSLTAKGGEKKQGRKSSMNWYKLNR